MIRGIAPLTAIGLLILGGASILLLALTTAEILQNDSVQTPKVEWEPKLSKTAERLTGAALMSTYQHTTAHPVFFKSRQPFVPPPPQPPPAPPVVALPPAPPPPVVDPGLVAGGIMISGEVKKVYLFRRGERMGSWLAKGEEMMGWRVYSIDSAGAKLRKDGRDIELPLYAQP